MSIRRFMGPLCAALLVAMTAQPVLAADSDDPWPEIRDLLFEGREIHDGAGVIRLTAPVRAHDAAIVPIKIDAEMPQTAERYIETVHVLIDENPAPIAGVFHFTPESGRASIATRVRVNEYTNVRAIAETNDGELYMATSYVKASGGCSAPSGLKDHSQAMARLGEMKLKAITPFQPDEPNQVKLLIRHPNYTGLQRDQLTRDWIPPHYIEEIEVTYGGKTIMLIDGDISLSENPSLHFSVMPDAPGELTVHVRDTEGGEFSRSLKMGRPAES